jgi:hypothetical protein
MASTDELWGGQLRTVTFDPTSHDCLLEIETLTNGRLAKYRLEPRHVTDLRFRNAIPEPWTYAEVTEIHSSREADGSWTLRLLLGSEDAELSLRCGDFALREVPQRA